MRCQICDKGVLEVTEYTAGELRAPALQCQSCKAFVLDEDMGLDEDERDEIRKAIEYRQLATLARMSALSLVPIDGGGRPAGRSKLRDSDATGIRKKTRAG
jgi:hypothetical protein